MSIASIGDLKWEGATNARVSEYGIAVNARQGGDRSRDTSHALYPAEFLYIS